MLKAFMVLLIPFLLLATVYPHPATASVSGSLSWTGSIFRGWDNFYQTSVVAFKTGQSATLNFQVYNDFSTPTTISAAKVRMDWGQNYTATGTPITLQPAQTRTFLVTFTVPDTSTASNLVTYAYTVIVEHNQGFPWTSSGFGERFAVYSNDQAGAQDLRQTYQALTQTIGPFAALPFPLSDSKTRALIVRAQTEFSSGERAYQTGDFTGSRQHYQNAMDLANQALDSMQAQGSSFESAVNNYLNLGRIGPILNGVGWLILGLGVLWYARRSPARAVAPPAAPPAQATQTQSP